MARTTVSKPRRRNPFRIPRIPKVQHNMYCGECGVITNHTLKVRGEWEIYTCSKGHSHEYKVL